MRRRAPRCALFALVALAGALSALLVTAGGAATTVTVLSYGNSGDVPITGDWNGLGTTQIGVYRPANETFYLRDSGGRSYAVLSYGNHGDIPITGDWNGSGTTQIGVYRPSNQTFYLRDSGGQPVFAQRLGNPQDIPITGDWNESGRTRIGVYRPSATTFYEQVVSPAPVTTTTAAPPVSTTPVTTPVPVLPPARRGPRRRLHVKITITWTWRHRSTRLLRLRVGRLPRSVTISMRCRGAGCPRPRVHSATAPRVRTLVRALDGSVYRAGDELSLAISAPGRIAERAVIRIRDGRVPAVRAVR